MTEGTGFPWGHTFGLLALSLLITAILWVLLSLLMMISLRRSLSGCITEARMKNGLLRYRLIFMVAMVTPAVWMFIQRQSNSGILLLLGAAVLSVIYIPSIHFFCEEAIEQRLASHLWGRRDEIEKAQRTEGQQQSSEQIHLDKVNRSALTAGESKWLEEMTSRFRLEQLLQHSGKSSVNDLIDGAARSLTSLGGVVDAGSNARMMAVVSELISLYIIVVSVSYFRFGLHIAGNAGLNESVPLLICIGSVLLAIPTIAIIRRIRSAWSCLVCGVKTTRVVRRGDMRIHMCSQACEKKLQTLLEKIR